MRIFISAGEPSGDVHGANLIQSLRRLGVGVLEVGLGAFRDESPRALPRILDYQPDFLTAPNFNYLLIAGVTALLIAKKRWRWATYLVFTVGTGALLNLVLKTYFQRARPDLAEALRHATGFSFPSGHAMGSMVTFGALSYVAVRALAHWQWRWRAAAVALALSIIVAIASSRVYLGVHWISDVGAGIVAGFIWVTASTVAYETFRRIRLLRAIRAKRGAVP